MVSYLPMVTWAEGVAQLPPVMARVALLRAFWELGRVPVMVRVPPVKLEEVRVILLLESMEPVTGKLVVPGVQVDWVRRRMVGVVMVPPMVEARGWMIPETWEP